MISSPMHTDVMPELVIIETCVHSSSNLCSFFYFITYNKHIVHLQYQFHILVIAPGIIQIVVWFIPCESLIMKKIVNLNVPKPPSLLQLIYCLQQANLMLLILLHNPLWLNHEHFFL
jgi:hypothetical protein